MQSFYGLILRKNKGNAENVSRATHAILKYYSSIAEHSKHYDCPEAAKSWCSYQRDIALGTNNHKCIQNPLLPAAVECIQPVFDGLGKLLMNYILLIQVFYFQRQFLPPRNFEILALSSKVNKDNSLCVG